MITAKTTKAPAAPRSTRRTSGPTTRDSATSRPRGVPRRALSDGITERRRTPRRRNEPALAPATDLLIAQPDAAEVLPPVRSASEHYRVEVQRRANRTVGDLASLLAEAKAEYEAQLAAPRPAGKGGRPKKKPVPKEEIELEEYGGEA